MWRDRAAFVMAVFAAFLLGGCAPGAERAALVMNGQAVSVEVARTEAQRERGLMERRDLGPRDGMIFVFDRDDHLSFWMKNTPTPLSIAFVSIDGRVLEIADMEPFSEIIVRSRLSARYAIEMRKGAFTELGVREGDTIALPAGFR
jgi:uncharacterized protein